MIRDVEKELTTSVLSKENTIFLAFFNMVTSVVTSSKCKCNVYEY
jgi:hypothetical protein